jgi:dihydrofolate reductase
MDKNKIEKTFLNNFSMIIATSTNGIIGRNNKLLWHLPNDLKRFKKLTTNKIIIMGFNSFKNN